MTDIASILWPLFAITVAVLAYHSVSKSIQLKYGLLLSKDKTDELGRAIDEIRTRLALDAQAHREQLNKLQNGYAVAITTDDLSAVVNQLNTLAANEAKFMTETVERIVKIEQTQAMALQGLVGNRKPTRLGQIP